jgi:hypothetical protein
MRSWETLTSHARVLLAIADDPGAIEQAPSPPGRQAAPSPAVPAGGPADADFRR